MAAKKVVVGAWLWWVVVGSAGLSRQNCSTRSRRGAELGGDSVSNHECDVAGFDGSRLSVCRSDVGVLAASLQGKLSHIVHRCALVGLLLRRYRNTMGVYPFRVCRAGRCVCIPRFGVECIPRNSCQVGWLKRGSSCSGGLNSEPGLIVVPG